MRHAFFLVLVFFLLSETCIIFGHRKVLVLTNKISGKETVVYHDGDNLKIVYQNGRIYRGRLFLTDTINQLGEDEIKIDSIRMIINGITEIKQRNEFLSFNNKYNSLAKQTLFGKKKILLLKNKKNGKEIEFQEGQRIKSVCSDGSVKRGRLKLIDTANILSYNEMELNDIKLNINEITKLKKSFLKKTFLEL